MPTSPKSLFKIISFDAVCMTQHHAVSYLIAIFVVLVLKCSISLFILCKESLHADTSSPISSE